MEIEFSPSQLPAPRASTPVKGAIAPSAATAAAPPQGMAELLSKLNDIPLTRPDKMAALQPAVSNLQYPPDQILNSIAHLLAIHLNQ
jgi:hypothetical protein